MPSHFDRTPPQNIEAERAVLGAMLLNPEAIQAALEVLGEDDGAFYVEAHQLLYRAVINLYRDGEPVDMVTLTNQLTESGALERSGGWAYVAELTDAVPTSANAVYYSEIVQEMWRRRSLITTCTTAIGELYKPEAETAEVLQSVEIGLFAVSKDKTRGRASQVGDLVPDARGFIQSMIDGEAPPGIKTGIPGLDAILDPLQPGDMCVIAARPSVGKTALGCNIMLNAAAKYECAVMMLSMEMTKSRITMRLLSILGGFDMQKIKGGKGSSTESYKLSKAAESLSRLPIYIDDDGRLSPLEMRSKVRAAVKDLGVGLVVIDYLQQMTAKAENRNNEITVISGEIKAAAKECGIPIIALAQLNREGAEGKPNLKHIRDGGAVEADTDIAILLSKADSENAVLADVAKNREGATGPVTLYFEKPTQRFRDFARNVEEPPISTPYKDQDNFPEDSYTEDYANADQPF